MKNKPIHALHSLAVLAFLTAVAQNSWGGHCYFYNKSIQIKVVPSTAGKVYADTKSDGSGTLGEDGFDTANIENMRSETGSDFRFDYCMNASYDELYLTSTDIVSNAKFVLSKVINRTQNEDGTDNTPPADEIDSTEGTSMSSPPNKFKVVIADKVTDDGHDGVLNGIFVVDGDDNKVFPNAASREAKGWHTYPDAYMYLYCGQVLTDKEDMPARDEGYEYLCYERTFLKGWNSVCLPFGIKTDDFKASLGEGCKLAVYRDYNDTENKIQFNTVSEVAAGIPCLIWSENSDSQVSLNINVAERGFADSPDNSTALKGSFTNATIGRGKLKLAGEETFSPTTSDDAVTYAYRAYVEVPAGHAKALTIDIDGETTTIGTTGTAQTSHATVYTVGGVLSNESARGLNIVKASDGSVKKVMGK